MEKKLVQRCETEVDGDACKASYKVEFRQEYKQTIFGYRNKTSSSSIYLADPGKARGCTIISFEIKSASQPVGNPFPPTAVRCRHAQTVRDSSSSY